MLNLLDRLKPAYTIVPQTLTQTGAGAGSAVDISLYRGNVLCVEFGAIANVANIGLTYQWEESADNNTWTAIANSNLVAPSTFSSASAGALTGEVVGSASNPPAAVGVSAANTIVRVGYIGSQRYVRCNITNILNVANTSYTLAAVVLSSGGMRQPS